MITAEDVLAGHPDRVCDAIAEGVVTYALRHDPQALVGVEVALHRRSVFITGRVAASDTAGTPITLGRAELEAIVGQAFASAGYTERWLHPVRVVSDLEVGGLDDDERGIRRLSDDQGIAVGYAHPRTPRNLPYEVTIVRMFREALGVARAQRPDVLGPDGKVLVSLTPGEGLDWPRLRLINVAIQHVDGVGYEDLLAWLGPQLISAGQQVEQMAKAPRGTFGGDRLLGPDRLRVNGIGDFTCGGPMGDNGLSGKKLVVDHYGPQVPIGGGAICGKDVHKPDRVGALRSRQIAVSLARATGLVATVTTGYLPGLETPDRLHARLGDGRELDADGIAALVSVPDLSLAGSARDLELASVDWQAIMRSGYFGSAQRWEGYR
jgi:S-adenosylmethionine synthetase